MARPGRVGKGAHGLGRLVGVGGQEVVEAVVADGFEKPFAERGSTFWRNSFADEEENKHVRPRKPVERVEAQARVFYQDGALDLLSVTCHDLQSTRWGWGYIYNISCPSALVERHLLDGPLQLGHIDALALDLDRGLEDGLDLAELVGVAGDEVDDMSGGGGGCHFCCWVLFFSFGGRSGFEMRCDSGDLYSLTWFICYLLPGCN